MTAPQWAVPYITMREGEESVPQSMLAIRYGRALRPVGIGYTHELPRDRDDRGVLWARVSQNLSPDTRRPRGKPLFASMHPARQRETMSSLRCQVCHGQPSRTEAGYLFLEMAGHQHIEGITTAQPPVCLEHAVSGINDCRRLVEQGYVLLRSKVPRLYGVVGQLYSTDGHELRPLPALVAPDGTDVPIPYTRSDLTPFVLASQLLRRLTQVTVVDIDAELEAAGRHPAQRTGRARGLAHAQERGPRAQPCRLPPA